MTVLTSNTAQITEDPGQECEESILPKWMTRYLQFRFDLLDRTGKLTKTLKWGMCWSFKQ